MTRDYFLYFGEGHHHVFLGIAQVGLKKYECHVFLDFIYCNITFEKNSYSKVFEVFNFNVNFFFVEKKYNFFSFEDNKYLLYVNLIFIFFLIIWTVFKLKEKEKLLETNKKKKIYFFFKNDNSYNNQYNNKSDNNVNKKEKFFKDFLFVISILIFNYITTWYALIRGNFKPFTEFFIRYYDIIFFSFFFICGVFIYLFNKKFSGIDTENLNSEDQNKEYYENLIIIPRWVLISICWLTFTFYSNYFNSFDLSFNDYVYNSTIGFFILYLLNWILNGDNKYNQQKMTDLQKQKKKVEFIRDFLFFIFFVFYVYGLLN